MLRGKLFKIMESVDYMKKESTNVQQRFDYVSSSQVLGVVRAKMKEFGVMLRPRIIRATFHHKDVVKGKQHFTELKMTMTWIDIESGEMEVNPWYGQGTDQHEKGVGKALTYAEKYFILKYFNIPTDKDDPDAFQEKTGQPQGEKNKDAPKESAFKPDTVADGLKLIGNKKVKIAGESVGLGEKYKDFIVAATKEKKRIGTETYYKVLADVAKVEKSLHINDLTIMALVINALKAAPDLSGQDKIPF